MSCDLRILNGRTKGDSFVKITYSPKGTSVVDYIIVNQDMAQMIKSFIVKQPTFSQITRKLFVGLKFSNQRIKKVNQR